MPTYQYQCTQCGQDLEVQQSFSDASLTECPACQGRLRKVFNAVGVVFKGSGFYRNDSRTANGSGGKDGDGGSKDSGAKDDGAKSDSKSEPKSDTKTETKADAKKPAKDSSSSSGSKASTSA